MKIGIITNLYPPYNRGGAERVVKNIVKGFLDEGHEVFVITAKPFKSFKSLIPKLEIDEGIKIYHFYPLNLFFYGNDYKHNFIWRMKWHFIDMFNFASAHKIKKILQREGPQVVFTHNLKGLGFQVPKVIKKLGIKHIHTVHDQQLANPKGYLIKGETKKWINNNFMVKYYEKKSRQLFNDPYLVISPSKFLLNFYDKKGFFKSSKKAMIPNPAKQPFKTLNIAPDKDDIYTFLFVGQIEFHKGVLFLINTFKQIKSQKVRLHIVGTGSKINLATKLAMADKRITIHGKLVKDRLTEIYSKSDYLIVPSLCYENSPTVIYEAFSLGVPVIASDIGGVAELVKNEKNGFIFEAGNAVKLMKIIERIMEPGVDWQFLKDNAKATVEEYTVENYVKQLLELIE